MDKTWIHFRRGEYFCYRDIREFTGMWSYRLDEVIKRLGVQTIQGPGSGRGTLLFTRADVKRILQEVLRIRGRAWQRQLNKVRAEEIAEILGDEPVDPEA
jgi:hypothetical protein